MGMTASAITIHPLRKWRDSQAPKVTVRQFCALLATAAGETVISHASLSRVEQGLQPPSLRLIRLAGQVTGGQVTACDFVQHGPA